ncbi:glycosyltransferase family 4 protein [Paenibacillus arenosi]|uniref:Glycosyltransferase family 4 protein n=1 Tax=Paenibacillus arenosi TaxID=2774142 RepID=A0ABR9B1M6_9BACL|nr:glycosyltransferase family 4 protein [Paenibacillus arenosi]MBD8500281.1 glycosyltransferase family 4 protein [Paenibacillus arenosi]
MKILFTFYVPSGGIDTLNRQRCQVLKQVGIEGHLLYTTPGSVIRNPTSIPMYTTSFDEDISQLIRTHRYQLIIVSSDYLMLERLRRLGYRGPILYEAQGLGHISLAEQTVKEAAPYLRQYAAGVHLPKTAHLIQLFRKYCPWLPQYSFPNVVNTDTIHYKYNPPVPNPIIAWVGRLEANKNWKHFLEIGYWMHYYMPNVRLWMFYDSTIYTEEDRQQFEPFIQKLNLQNILTIRDRVPHAHMSDYYSMIGDSGGFLLSTSQAEGFGYAVAEAMSCRCPVLSTDSDGVRAFITHNITGKFYPFGYIEQAVQEGRSLISDQALRASIREQGVYHIKNQFSPSKYQADFLNMVNQVLVLTHNKRK